MHQPMFMTFKNIQAVALSGLHFNLNASHFERPTQNVRRTVEYVLILTFLRKRRILTQSWLAILDKYITGNLIFFKTI